MGEPEHAAMHNFSYHPTVANWVHSTSLAQLDGTSEEPPDQSPDDFYKSPYHHRQPDFESSPSTTDMTSTRQRQQTANGSVRSTPKPSVRSVSGPASSSIAAARATQLPVNRPTVKSLAQRFNQPSSAESSPPSTRVRPARPASSAKSFTDAPAPPASISSSPARPTKEAAAYGTYKFNNLKPRERPQPAPASPASARRANDRSGRDEQTTPSRRKLSSPTRGQTQRTSTGRQPFFGEVVGEHDEITPGFGIPSVDPMANDLDPIKLPIPDKSTIKLVDTDLHLSPKAPPFGHLPVRHRRSPSDMTSTSAGDGHPKHQSDASLQREARRHSPPSRIPVASRRMSVASDSGSSNRSLKVGSSRPVGSYRRRSPTHSNNIPNGNEKFASRKPKAPTQQMLPAVSYRGYRERGKSPQSAAVGASMAAVITAPPPPTSPRLRNSRERQLLPHESSESTIRTVDQYDGQDYFQNGNDSRAYDEPQVTSLERDQVPPLSEGDLDNGVECANETVGFPTSHSQQPEYPTNEQDANSSMAHQESLTVHTSALHVPQVPAPLSSTTDFEHDESPILGMPGSFMMTPPIAQYTPPVGSEHEERHSTQSPPTTTLPVELLQARTFHPPSRSHTADAPSEVPPTALSEIGIRESIPIMLGVDEQEPDWAAPNTRPGHSPRLSIGAHRWRAEPLDSTGTISYLNEDDSPIDPFANRDSLRPDDSASVAFYRQAERRTPDWTPKIPEMPESRRMTMDSEAYSVINKVLNLYHQSATISLELANDSQRRVRNVSPIIAQHKDWGSKEATETYLARLLSDATVTEDLNDNGPAAEETRNVPNHKVPALSIRELDDDPSEPHAGGTAIIFPPESRRYSRGSRGSTTTTIWDDGSRADSSSVNLARDSARDSARDDFTQNQNQNQNQLPASTYAPHPPPKEWQPTYYAEPSNPPGFQPRISHERPAPSFGSLLPEIEGAGEGLGLSLQSGQQQPPRPFQYPQPPRPSYSPPPPPVQPSIDRTAAVAPSYTPSVYNRQPPSSIIPSAPLPAKMGGVFSNPYEVLDNAFEGDDGNNLLGNDDAPETEDIQSDHDHTPDTDALQVVQAPNSAGIAAAPQVPGITLLNVDPVTQTLRRRYRTMEELIKTEQLFFVDMMVADSVFEATSVACLNERERRTLFCNVQEICKLSHLLYQDLKRAARPIANPEPSPDEKRKEMAAAGETALDQSVQLESDEPWDEFKYLSVENDRKTNIGEIMNEHMPKLERLFTTYLLNHGDASDFIKAHSEDGAVLGWVKACFIHSKDLTNAWDLDSLLVKPVQRLMKYPLLLDGLEKVTAPDHPDLPAIKAARQEMIEINTRINQAKKRQETLREATKEGKKQKNKGLLENRLGKGFFVKPFSSKSDRSKQQAGAAPIFSDDEYDFLSQKFGGHFFQIQVVIRDIETYLDTMTDFMCNTNCLVLMFIALMESAPTSHPELESTWRRQAMAFFELQNVALEDHKTVVRQKVLKPILELWGLHGRPQKLMDQRKKGLQPYVKYKQAIDRKEKVDPKLEDAGQSFVTINNTLKMELPKLYDLTKKCIRACLNSFVSLQKDWWKNCQKKILPLLEYEPEHTTSITFDLKAYVDRFHSDFASVEAVADRLALVNHSLLQDVQNYMSPLPIYTDDSSSRKSSSRRTESMSSDASMMEPKKRYSGGYNSQRNPTLAPRSSPAMHASLARERAERAMSPGSERSDATLTHNRNHEPALSYSRSKAQAAHLHYTGFDGTFDGEYGPTSSMGSSLLSPNSNPGSSRTSGVFNSALPLSDSGLGGNRDETPTTPATPTDMDEPEVLFLAASLFEFNIAHDRREGGIPYLVYVPGEIFDVIGMKGELWLARNQDDTTRTVGWIWEKHFARILPEDG